MIQEERNCKLDLVSLETAIDLVHAKDNKVFTDYQELANKINSLFKYNVTAEDITEYYESVFYIESLDRQIQTSYLGINY